MFGVGNGRSLLHPILVYHGAVENVVLRVASHDFFGVLAERGKGVTRGLDVLGVLDGVPFATCQGMGGVLGDVEIVRDQSLLDLLINGHEFHVGVRKRLRGLDRNGRERQKNDRQKFGTP